MASYSVVERIAKLLRLAVKHPDTHEGQTAMAIARGLMAKHGINVELDDDSKPAPPPNTGGWVDVGRYASREVWRNTLADLVSVLFGIMYGWKATIDGEVQLGMCDPQSETGYLDGAVDYFRSLELLVEQSRPLTLLGIREAYGNEAWIIDVYRRGIADAIVQRLASEPRLRKPPEPPPPPGPQLPPRHPTPSEVAAGIFEPAVVRFRKDRKALPESKAETALVLCSSFTMPREDVADVPPNEVPLDEGPQIHASDFSPTRMVYLTGVSVGRSLFVPRPRRP